MGYIRHNIFSSEMTAFVPKSTAYMADGVHPNAHGYSAWWGPVLKANRLLNREPTDRAAEEPAAADELDIPKPAVT